MWIYWIVLFAGIIISFFVGFFIRQFKIKKSNRRESAFQNINKIILDLYSNVTSLINIEKIISSLFSQVKNLSVVDSVFLLRYDGESFVDGLDNSPYDSEVLKDFVKQYFFSQDINDYIDCDKDSLLYEVFLKKESPDKNILVRVYPITYDFLNITYLYINIYNKPIIDSGLGKFFLYIKRQLFLLLYLKEVSVKYKANQEFLDGVFNNNPVSISLTDNTGEIQKGNKEFYRIFPKNFMNIKNLLDDESLASISEGRTLDKDFTYDQP